MPLFHHDFPDDMPPTELAHAVRKQLNTIMVLVIGVLSFLVLVVLSTLVFVSLLLGKVNTTAEQTKKSSTSNTKTLEIIERVTSPSAQAQQASVIGDLVDQIQCSQRRTALMLPPVSKGQPCVYPPGQQPPPPPPTTTTTTTTRPATTTTRPRRN